MRPFIMMLLGLLILGCAQRGEEAPATEPAAANPPAGDAGGPPAADAAAPAVAAQPAAPAEDRSEFGKHQARLVDKHKAMAENPSLVEVENKVNASDPLTAIAQSYFSATSRAYLSTLQYDLRLKKELNDGRWPSFDEFEKSLKQSGIQLKGLYRWQMYAYDDQTGGITILEDKAEKKRDYEAAGREYTDE